MGPEFTGENRRPTGVEIGSQCAMRHSSKATVECKITGQVVPAHRAIPFGELRESVRKLAKKRFPDLADSDYISQDEANRLRMERIQQMLTEDKRSVTRLEKEVLKSIEERSILSHDPLGEAPDDLTLGQRLADRVASFGGSWGFIIAFFLILAGWIGLNAGLLLSRPFDPYPFILLNLILSCLAAIQAPVIMMSQNRQEAKDRLRSMHDYQVNLKAELEIRALHEKLDRLIGHQWSQLLEIQQIQMDMIEEMRAKKG